MVWTESRSEQREDSYRVVLHFRRPARGLGEEQIGEEEFLFDLTGVLQDRQVLVWPEGGEISTGGLPETSVTPDAKRTVLSTRPLVTALPPIGDQIRHSIVGIATAIAASRGMSYRVLGRIKKGRFVLQSQPGNRPEVRAATVPETRSTTRRGGPTRTIARRMIRVTGGAVLVSWSVFILAGGGTELSQGNIASGSLLIPGVIGTFLASASVLLWNNTRMGRLRNGKILLWLIVCALVVSFVGIVLAGG